MRRQSKGKGKAKANIAVEDPDDAVTRFGFDKVFERMDHVPEDIESHMEGLERVLNSIIKRLEGTGDLELVAQR